MNSEMKRRARRSADYFGVRLCKPLRSVPQSTNEVFLTFDDGPNPEFTEQIAATLEEFGHRGTFFVTGSSAVNHPGIVKRLASAGHTIGSHSSQHLPQWETKSRDVLADYKLGHAQVERSLGESTKLFRPPYGEHDYRSALFALQHRLKLVLWSIDPEDWKEDAKSEAVSKLCSSELKPGKIVLLHDAIYDNPSAADRTATVEAVAKISDEMRNKGLVGAPLR